MNVKTGRRALPALIAACIWAADQLIKHAVRQVPYDSVLMRVPGVLEITHCVNTGAAFSMLTGRTVLLALLSVALLGAILVFFMRCTRLRTSSAVALAALVGGGLGNLTDRVVFGGVTDYIRLLFISFPVFNLADICITCSILFLILELLTGRLDPFPEKP